MFTERPQGEPGRDAELDREIAGHYRRDTLEQEILAGLAATGVELDALSHESLAAVDEFHIGGRKATAALVEQLELAPDMQILDVGCGIGGTARYLAAAYGCRVTGIDLTDRYVAVAASLARRVGLAERLDFVVGSALAMPFPRSSFAGATLLHVGMNIPDKRSLFRELARVVSPGGFLAVYDVMRTADGELRFPVPWASSAETSFLEELETYSAAARDAGFEIFATRDRHAAALDFFHELQARIAADGPPPLGVHVLMGEGSAAKIANIVAGLEQGIVAPTELICRLPG